MKAKALFVGLGLLFGDFNGVHGEEVVNGECSAGSMNGNDGTCTAKEQPKCKFYLAPSSIPNAGFGVYTTADIKESDFLQESDAQSVLVYDGDSHYPNNRLWSMEHYFWSGEGTPQFECASVEEYVVTFGTSCNFHTYLKNILPQEAAFTDTLTPRAEGSPGIGAYSYHGGAKFYASRDIKAGEELFADYGEEWLDARKYLGDIPRQEDYDKAGEVIMKLTSGLKDGDINEPFLNTVKDVVKVFNKRIGEALIPSTEDEFKEILTLAVKSDNNSSTVNAVDIAQQLAFKSLAPRDIDWIISEGQCLDNLVKKPSTIPHAGMGAFARRFIPKGETVIIAPLLHIMEDKSTLMYPLVYDEDEEEMVIEDDEPSGKQLIVNYCFAHEESTMLLCPQTNAILINHCSAREDYGGDCEKYNKNKVDALRGANTEIRWATEWDTDTKEWLKMTFSKLRSEVKKGKRGLSFEVIATRDIYPGDEVFLDYGERWEKDWAQHVAEWVPPSADDYIPLDEMREMDYFATEDELEENPYPSNVMTMCHYILEEGEEYDEDEDEEETEKDDDDWISDGSDINDAPLSTVNYWPCNVLSREADEDGEDIYEVEILQSTTPGAEITVWHRNEQRRILQNLRKNVIKFVSTEYASDQYLPGVFRSSLNIPDKMFPEAWRDRKN